MSDYVGPIVTADAVVMRHRDGVLEVLIHERPREPFAGVDALPGVYVQRGETVRDATERAVQTKAGLSLQGAATRTHEVFDAAQRDPRGHALSIVTLSLVPADEQLTEGAGGRWVPASEATGLAFDHDTIVAHAVLWVAEHLWSDRFVLAGLLMGQELTTARIKKAAQAVGRDEPTSNMRRRIVGTGMLAERPDAQARPSGRGRPSKVWGWVE